MCDSLSGRRRSDGQEDHRRHIRRLGGSRGRSFLREGLHQGGPLGCLRRPLGGQVSGEGQTVQEGSGPGQVNVTKCTDHQQTNLKYVRDTQSGKQ